MDDPMPYAELPIKFDEYSDFISICVSGSTQSAVLARRSEVNYFCLQLQHLPDSHLIRAIASNLARTVDAKEAYEWLPIVRLCFITNPHRYTGLIMKLYEMASRAPSTSSTVSDLQKFMTNWHAVNFRATDEIVTAVVQYNTQKPDLHHLYTLP